MWEIAQKLNAWLYLVNYAKKGTKHEDEVLFMLVKNVDENNAPNFVETEDYKMTRKRFAKKFREMNLRGRT